MQIVGRALGVFDEFENADRDFGQRDDVGDLRERLVDNRFFIWCDD